MLPGGTQWHGPKVCVLVIVPIPVPKRPSDIDGIALVPSLRMFSGVSSFVPPLLVAVAEC